MLTATIAVANVMKNQIPPGGSIIGISSISALVGGELQCHYTPTKAGILSLMQSCAIALGKYGIRANAILPGTIATDINKEDLADEKKREYTINRTVLKRLGSELLPTSPFADELNRHYCSNRRYFGPGCFFGK
ncbi:L-rhamnose-1-dehydrogenase [Termitomyces sp. 'cryptogamus']|nr:L-rhamnose-1-dehydrogenase [Termitomyces sp. 'cryptogamus']